jgi:hypothetical protein
MRARHEIPDLPDDLVHHPKRVLDTNQSCKFTNLSPRQWTRLKQAGKTPPPVKITAKKEGYRLGDLIDLVDASTCATTAG